MRAKKLKTGIVGSGRLGGLFGFALAQRNLCRELVFVDVLPEMAEGQAEDVLQALALSRLKTRAKFGYEKLKDSDIVILTAGKPRTPEIKSRLELVEINAKIIANVAREVVKHAPNSILITVTNPMDVMNYVAFKCSGIPRERVIGSGGQLDTARFKLVLSRLYRAPKSKIDAFVIGEHGDAQVPLFSRVKIRGEARSFSDEEKKRIHEELRQTALAVITKKKATEFAPVACTLGMIEAVARDSKNVLPCSVVLNGEYGVSDVSIGVPVRLGRGGAEGIEVWDISEEEKNLFLQGAGTLKEYCAGAEKSIQATPPTQSSAP
ncbi:MAG: malate dehydrogenase [Candidatus Micrarchaeota archaeon]